MPELGNIFDNSAAITPSLEGQGEPAPAGNEPEIDPAVAPPDGQGVQEPAPAPETDPEPSVADWQSEFESPEAMYAELQKTKKSYGELRPQFTKVTQELSTIKKGQTAQPPVQGQATEPQSENPVDVLLNRVAAIVQPVKEQNEELMMQNEISRIASANPDFIELAPEVSQVLKDNPDYWNIKNPIETVYKIVKAQKVNEQIATAAANARKQAYEDKDIKVISGADTRTPVNNGGTQKSEEELIREGIVGVYSKRNSVF